MPESLECLRKHRHRYCQETDQKCWAGRMTISEDAPDVAALAAMVRKLLNLDQIYLNSKRKKI